MERSPPGIYTTLRERVRSEIHTHGAIRGSQIAMTHIGNKTYFRHAQEMWKTDEQWKLQAINMIACEVRVALAEKE